MKLTILPFNQMNEKEYAFVDEIVHFLRKVDLADVICDVTIVPLVGEDIFTGSAMVTLNIYLTISLNHKSTRDIAAGIENMALENGIDISIHMISPLQRDELQRQMINPIMDGGMTV